jgi:methionyl-tRNA synthetase
LILILILFNYNKYILQNQDENNKSIYLTNYSGYYNVKEETYITDFHALETDYKDPVTKIPYEIVNEPTYNFKLCNNINEINSTINTIIPLFEQNCIKTRVEKGLHDISITRTTFDWGIQFPNNEKHVIYVWFDALLNYITGKNLLYGDTNNKMIHLIGKDIIWFHSVIYPAILKSCNYEKFLPHKILVHGFILDKDGKKMSKSLNNVISNKYIFDKFPVEAIRYYFIVKTILGQDLKFNENILVDSFNNILLKNFGNLFQRLHKVAKPIVNELNDKITLNNDDIIKIKNIFKEKIILNFLDSFDFDYYNNTVHTLMSDCNKDLTEKTPWKLDINENVDVMYDVIVKFNIIMCLMYPIIPSKINELSQYFGWENKLNFNENIILTIENKDKIIAFKHIKN